MESVPRPTVADHLPSPPQRALSVAVVTETYPPEVNGVAATLSRVVEGLGARGHRLQLVRPRQGRDGGDVPACPGCMQELLVPGLPIPRYPQLKMGLPSRARLVHAWQQQRPDVVHIVTEGPLGWSALRAATQLRLPVVSDFRTNFQAYSRHYGLAWLHRPILGLLRSFHNRAACTMVPTEALRRELQADGFERLRVIARGVDTRLFDPARRSDALRASWGVPAGGRVVLCVGRLAAEKNLHTLIDAFAAMHQVDVRLRLVLVGDGPSRSALQQRCPQAVLAGTRHGEDLAAHYASADLFLFPSVTETFGNVVPEAMASALAVLAFDHAAAGQLIRSGQDGVLARLADSADFCREAVRLVTATEWARHLGQQARRTASRLGWEHIVQGVELEYRAAMQAHAAELEPAASPHPA